MAKLVWEIPIRTVSEANRKEHWTLARKRHLFQQEAIKGTFRRSGCVIVLPCTIRMVRLSSRFLDASDNLPMAFKWIKDEIADCISPEPQKWYVNAKGKTRFLKGRSDDHPDMKWEYGQEKSSSFGIRIEIEHGGA